MRYKKRMMQSSHILWISFKIATEVDSRSRKNEDFRLVDDMTTFVALSDIEM
jgi:hypothetical protein